MKPILEAHRGFSGRFPENTLISFRNAVLEGGKSIELDVHTTRDGVLVVMHDANVDRTTDGHGPIAEKTLAEMKALDAGAWKGFPGERVPTLEETLKLTDETGVAFNIEVKRFSDTAAPAKLVELIKAHRPAAGMTHVVSSFDTQALLQVRAAGCDVPLCQLGNDAAKILELARANKFEWIHSAYQTVTPEIVEAAHKDGIKVMIWTVNDATSYCDWKNMGVDKICSNWIREMLAAERSAIQLGK